jgi:vancomycin resistance protein VanJ
VTDPSGKRTFIAAISALGALAVIALAATSSLLPRVPPWLAMAAAFLPLAILPCLFCVLLAIVSRSRAAIIVALVAALALAAIYGPLWLPHATPYESEYVDPMRVMAWNVGWQTQGPELLNPIRDADAAIVAVQESRHETAQTLRRELAASYPHQLAEPRYGMTVLLARYPILKQEWFSLPGDRWPSLEAGLNWNGTPLTVIVPHTTWPRFDFYEDTFLPIGFEDDIRVDLAAEIVRRATAAPGPVIVMGDLNMTDRNPAYRVLANELTDVHRRAGNGFGFTWPLGLRIRGIPVPGPLIRIDYIWTAGAILVLDSSVGCDSGSDHCHLLAEVAKAKSQ